MTNLRNILLAILAAGPMLLLWAGTAAAGVLSSLFPTKTRETFGPFEITRSESSYTYSSGDVRNLKSVRQTYTLRHRGEPVRIHVLTGREGDPGYLETEFHELATFTTSQPVLLVKLLHQPTMVRMVYLLREDGPNLRIERAHVDVPFYVGEPGGPYEYQRLDPTPPPVGESVPPPSSLVLRIPGSGRWLLAGFTAAIDTQTFAVLHFPMRPEHQYTMQALMVAPDGNSFVRKVVGTGSSIDHQLIVFNLPDLSTYSLPITPQRMQFVNRSGASYEVTRPAWLHHHFEWLPRAGGGYQLAERKKYNPWPAGEGLLDTDTLGNRSYVIRGFRAGLGERLLAFAESEFKARRVDRADPRLAQDAPRKPDPADRYFAVDDVVTPGADAVILKLHSEDGLLSLVPLRGQLAPELDKIALAFGHRIISGQQDDLVIR